MKCEKCKYLIRGTKCRLFDEDIPEKFVNKNGNGCCLHYKELRKLNKLMENYYNSLWYNDTKNIDSCRKEYTFYADNLDKKYKNER